MKRRRRACFTVEKAGESQRKVARIVRRILPRSVGISNIDGSDGVIKARYGQKQKKGK